MDNVEVTESNRDMLQQCVFVLLVSVQNSNPSVIPYLTKTVTEVCVGEIVEKTDGNNKCANE